MLFGRSPAEGFLAVYVPAPPVAPPAARSITLGSPTPPVPAAGGSDYVTTVTAVGVSQVRSAVFTAGFAASRTGWNLLSLQNGNGTVLARVLEPGDRLVVQSLDGAVEAVSAPAPAAPATTRPSALPALAAGTYRGWFDFTDAATLTKDSGNRVSGASNKVTGGSAVPALAVVDSAHRPLWVADAGGFGAVDFHDDRQNFLRSTSALTVDGSSNVAILALVRRDGLPEPPNPFGGGTGLLAGIGGLTLNERGADGDVLEGPFDAQASVVLHDVNDTGAATPYATALLQRWLGGSWTPGAATGNQAAQTVRSWLGLAAGAAPANGVPAAGLVTSGTTSLRVGTSHIGDSSGAAVARSKIHEVVLVTGATDADVATLRAWAAARLGAPAAAAGPGAALVFDPSAAPGSRNADAAGTAAWAVRIGSNTQTSLRWALLTGTSLSAWTTVPLSPAGWADISVPFTATGQKARISDPAGAGSLDSGAVAVVAYAPPAGTGGSTGTTGGGSAPAAAPGSITLSNATLAPAAGAWSGIGSFSYAPTAAGETVTSWALLENPANFFALSGASLMNRDAAGAEGTSYAGSVAAFLSDGSTATASFTVRATAAAGSGGGTTQPTTPAGGGTTQPPAPQEPTAPAVVAGGASARLDVLIRGQSNGFMAVEFGADRRLADTLAALTGMSVNLISRRGNADGANTHHSSSSHAWVDPYDFSFATWLRVPGGDYGSNAGRMAIPYGGDPAGWSADNALSECLAAVARFGTPDASVPFVDLPVHHEYDLVMYGDAQPSYAGIVREVARRIRVQANRPAGRHFLSRLNCPYVGKTLRAIDAIGAAWEAEIAAGQAFRAPNMQDATNLNNDSSHWNADGPQRSFPRAAFAAASALWAAGLCPPGSLGLGDAPRAGPGLGTGATRVSASQVDFNVAHDRGTAIGGQSGFIDWSAFAWITGGGAAAGSATGGSVSGSGLVSLAFPGNVPASGARLTYCRYPGYRADRLLVDNWHSIRPAKYANVPWIGTVVFPLRRDVVGVPIS